MNLRVFGQGVRNSLIINRQFTNVFSCVFHFIEVSPQTQLFFLPQVLPPLSRRSTMKAWSLSYWHLTFPRNSFLQSQLSGIWLLLQVDKLGQENLVPSWADFFDSATGEMNISHIFWWVLVTDLVKENFKSHFVRGNPCKVDLASRDCWTIELHTWYRQDRSIDRPGKFHSQRILQIVFESLI